MKLSRERLSVLAVLALVGCGAQQADYSKIDLLEAGGTVTLDGIPLQNAVVTFESPETGSFSYAMTDRRGDFHLQLDSEKSGVTPGEKIVRISTARKILGLNSDEEGGEFMETGDPAEEGAVIDGSHSDEELLPPAYHRDSVLRVTVSDSETEFQFDLKTEGEEVSAAG